MNLSTPISKLFMVGPTYARRLKKLNIATVEDLLYHFPFRYLDYSLVSPIAGIQPGETVTIQGRMTAIKNEYTSRGKKIQKGTVVDETGSIEVVWFNQPFLIRTLRPGTPVSLSGKADFWGRKITIVSPEYEILKSSSPLPTSRPTSHFSLPPPTLHTGRLVPVYHETYGVSSKWLRSRIAPLIEKALPSVEDFLPLFIRTKYDLLEIKTALRQIHFPQNPKEAKRAKERFAFEELFLIHLATLQRKIIWQKKKLAHRLKIDQEKVLKFTRSLSFELTQAQKRALREILSDLGKDRPMNRLLEGDVGSGKTIVAAASCYVACLNQLQSAVMAPTEILAHQHYQTLEQVLSPLGVKISLLTGSQRKTEEKFDLLVGTHALVHKRGKFQKLGLVIIDEQHRFGVEQRGKLIKKGKSPHVLTMTATPIPRTIALTLYGDLDLSVIDEMPLGRKEIKTWVVPPQKREAAYGWIREQIKNNRSQVFIICPLIEESAHETMQSVRAAMSEFQKLQKKIFPDLKLGLLHGRLKSKEKNEVLEKFKKSQLDILVSTPVVEVGIDVPTATIMMVEAAERFGLAQLHQLRGRVGRGFEQSYCLLFTELRGEKITQRLKALEKTNLGMELAELDLKLRGPGEIYGTKQHGLLDLKVASFNDLALIKKTKQAASLLITCLAGSPRFPSHRPVSPTRDGDEADGEAGRRAHYSLLAKYPLLQARLKRDTMREIEPN